MRGERLAHLLLFGLCACGGPTSPFRTNPQDERQRLTGLPGLELQKLRTGSGPTAKVGDFVKVHYRVRVQGQAKGVWIGDSFETGRPLIFSLGERGGEVVEGVHKAVEGMQSGELREAIVAPKLAYGDRRTPGIAPGSTLVFELALVKISPH